MNTQGTHKLFSTDYTGFESASVRIYQLQPRGGGVPASTELGGLTRASLGQATYWLTCLELPAGMCYYLPSQPKCQVSCWKGPTPADVGIPPSSWTKPFGIAVRACWVVPSSSWWRKLRNRESSSDAWVWRAVLSRLPPNEMMPPGRCFCACTQLQKIVSPQYVKLLKIN